MLRFPSCGKIILSSVCYTANALTHESGKSSYYVGSMILPTHCATDKAYMDQMTLHSNLNIPVLHENLALGT
jgi:hypothetical protein